jgi:hypothetical protein
MYGALLMAKIQHAAFSKHDPKKRVPFFLYVDEFQSFQASEDFTALMKSALGIIATYVVFQLNPEDATFNEKKIAKEDHNKHLRDMRDKLYLDWLIAPPGDGREKIGHRLGELTEIVNNLPPALVTIQDAIDLEPFEAIYKIGAQPAVKEPTPTPAKGDLSEGEKRKIAYINDHSKEHYG